MVGVIDGKDLTKPVLLLNAHYDVVPAALEQDGGGWTIPPFQGIRKDGYIYGRGTQDMKCVCMQYIQALHKIVGQQPPERSIVVTFVPDEEVGGGGMAAFLESNFYRSLPGIALALDEGLANPGNAFSVFYGERLPWWVDVEATGPTGHGSRFIEHTAVEQLLALTQKALEFRQGQRDQLNMSDHENCTHAVARKLLGDVTSLNITRLQAGVSSNGEHVYNCVPPKAACSLDIRISPHVEPATIGAMLDDWCRECSANPPHAQLTWKYAGHGNDMKKHATTSTDAKVNPWYKVFADALEGHVLEPAVFPAATDSRFLRALGIRALGFSPMKNTEILLHENDECIPEQVYLDGVEVYVKLIQTLAWATGPELDE